MVNEIWRDIKNYEGLYQISNLGRVKSLCNNKTRKEKILKNKKNKYGYLQVGLSKNGKQKYYRVHRLVAEAFLPNSDNLPCVEHINTNKIDNRLCNLRWCTPKENMNNPITIDKLKKNVHLKENFSKPIIQFSKDGEYVKKWKSATDVEREIGINKGNICSCCKGKRKSVGGFKWSYAN